MRSLALIPFVLATACGASQPSVTDPAPPRASASELYVSLVYYRSARDEDGAVVTVEPASVPVEVRLGYTCASGPTRMLRVPIVSDGTARAMDPILCPREVTAIAGVALGDWVHGCAPALIVADPPVEIAPGRVEIPVAMLCPNDAGDTAAPDLDAVASHGW